MTTITEMPMTGPQMIQLTPLSSLAGLSSRDDCTVERSVVSGSVESVEMGSSGDVTLRVVEAGREAVADGDRDLEGVTLMVSVAVTDREDVGELLIVFDAERDIENDLDLEWERDLL